MRYIEGIKRDQVKLLPPTIEEYVDEENPVRVIEEFVNLIDLEELGIKRYKSKEIGRKGYDPRDIIKILIYGYANKIRSSRNLMKETKRNLELIWLIKGLSPDFRTISDFRKDNAKGLKNIFKKFVDICIKTGLYNKELIAIDGTKIKAVNAKGKNYTQNKINSLIKRLDKDIEEYLNELEKNDEIEKNEKTLNKEDIKQIIESLNKKKQKYEELKNEMKKQKTTQISLTDPQSRRMINNGKYDICYNVQSAVDSKNHMILDFLVTNEVNDLRLLSEVSKKAKDILGVDKLNVLADNGYVSQNEILECLKNAINPCLSLKQNKSNKIIKINYNKNIITNKILNSLDYENIKKCLESGIIPNVYHNTHFKIKTILKNEEKLSVDLVKRRDYFERDIEKDIVICPTGQILKRASVNKKNNKIRYYRKSACKYCKEKCTVSGYKQVDFKHGQTICKLKNPDNIIKNDVQKEFKQPKSRVELTYIPDKDTYKLRKSIVEHPFGTLKRHLDAGYLLLKGRVKAAGELSLSFLAYNMKRAVNLLGTKQLIQKMREIMV